MFPLSIALIAIIDQTNGKFFSDLYKEYGKKSYYIALKIVMNHHDAEEVVQDTFLKIYKVIEKVHNLPREKIAPFIVICIKHTAFDLIEKKEKRVKTVELTYDDDGEEKEYEVADDSPLPDEIVISKERAMNLGRCIDSQLSPQRNENSRCQAAKLDFFAK